MSRKVLRPFSRTGLPLITATVLVVVALAGCGMRTIGFGVLLWSEDEEVLRSGTVIPVISESNLNDIYLLDVEEPAGEMELSRWRVEFFPAREAADTFAADLGRYATVYATSSRNALPMRSEPSLNQDNIVYRLRLGETIKIIGRDPEQTNLSGLVSYWYQALTDVGVRGFVFGHELSLFDPFDGSVAEQQLAATDPLVDLLLSNVWRPIYFVDMITSGAFDLALFRPEYGLFPRPEENTLELVMPYHSTKFRYERIADVGLRKYLAEGTTLQMTFRRNDELSLQYLLDGRQYSLAMQRVHTDIEEYVDAELERRSEVYDDLVERGPVYSSDNYGTIQFLENQRFKWTNNQRLVPTVIPSGTGAAGKVNLGLYLSEDLESDYSGALSLLFDDVDEPVCFLYSLSATGIRMVYVPRTDIDDRLVLRVGMNALTLFFSASGG